MLQLHLLLTGPCIAMMSHFFFLPTATKEPTTVNTHIVWYICLRVCLNLKIQFYILFFLGEFHCYVFWTSKVLPSCKNVSCSFLGIPKWICSHTNSPHSYCAHWQLFQLHNINQTSFRKSEKLNNKKSAFTSILWPTLLPRIRLNIHINEFCFCSPPVIFFLSCTCNKDITHSEPLFFMFILPPTFVTWISVGGDVKSKNQETINHCKLSASRPPRWWEWRSCVASSVDINVLKKGVAFPFSLTVFVFWLYHDCLFKPFDFCFIFCLCGWTAFMYWVSLIVQAGCKFVTILCILNVALHAINCTGNTANSEINFHSACGQLTSGDQTEYCCSAERIFCSCFVTSTTVWINVYISSLELLHFKHEHVWTNLKCLTHTIRPLNKPKLQTKPFWSFFPLVACWQYTNTKLQ